MHSTPAAGSLGFCSALESAGVSPIIEYGKTHWQWLQVKAQLAIAGLWRPERGTAAFSSGRSLSLSLWFGLSFIGFLAVTERPGLE
jgi:hypothetical protein